MARRWLWVLGFLPFLLWQQPALNPARAEAEHETVAAETEAAQSEEGELLAFRPSLAVATLIVFVVLLAVLWKFAWGPLSKALHDREHHLEQTLHETERARAEAERLLAEHRQQMAQAADQVRAILEEARRDAAQTADEIMKKAQAESEAARQRAETEIGLAKDQALKELWTQSANLAVDIAGRVLSRELREEDHRRLVELATSELPAAPRGQEGLN